MQADRAGAPETICPCCRRPLTPTKAIREAIYGAAQALDRRAYPRLAQPLPKARQRLGESQSQSARILAPRLNPPHAPKTLQSRLIFPDRLLDAIRVESKRDSTGKSDRRWSKVS